MDYGEKLKAIRTAEGMTQAEFAEATGINLRSYQNAESGHRGAGLPMVEAAAKRWPKYSQWLLTDTTSPENGQVSPEQEKARRDSARDGTHVA